MWPRHTCQKWKIAWEVPARIRRVFRLNLARPSGQVFSCPVRSRPVMMTFDVSADTRPRHVTMRSQRGSEQRHSADMRTNTIVNWRQLFRLCIRRSQSVVFIPVDIQSSRLNSNPERKQICPETNITFKKGRKSKKKLRIFDSDSIRYVFEQVSAQTFQQILLQQEHSLCRLMLCPWFREIHPNGLQDVIDTIMILCLDCEIVLCLKNFMDDGKIHDRIYFSNFIIFMSHIASGVTVRGYRCCAFQLRMCLHTLAYWFVSR